MTTTTALLSRRTNNASSTRIAPPTFFLALAPTTSSSYPAFRPSLSRSSTASSSAFGPPAPLPPATLPSQIPLPPHDDFEEQSLCEAFPLRRRTSSVTSVNSVGSGRMRFLRLGPVHGGEDAVADYCEVDE